MLQARDKLPHSRRIEFSSWFVKTCRQPDCSISSQKKFFRFDISP
uniref:Uncharacterized protein n=1 Tax=Arundo donax TaxID=35708 RepID=A0A0A9FJ20_ARUDO